MGETLNNLTKEMNLDKFSLKDLANFYEKYDKAICKIITDEEDIIFKFDVNALPHLLGIGHILSKNKNKKSFKGKQGFLKLKNGEITIEMLKESSKLKNNFDWLKIRDRIKFFVMFLNSIEKTKLKVRDDNLLIRKTVLKGNYFLYRNYKNNMYPLFSIKKIDNEKYVLETFIVERNLTLLGALKEQRVLSISIEKKEELVNV